MVKLGDFGIARVLNNTRDNARTMVGTPYYLSPEIVENRPYGFQSDMWALGVLLYEMCTLKPPFDGQSLHHLALKIARGNYPPPPARYSSDLKGLIASLLAVRSEQRPKVGEVLKLPFIQTRIRSFLTESVRMDEFSHTVLH
jgi:NIMA (never in mitosis gene a)-related kinase